MTCCKARPQLLLATQFRAFAKPVGGDGSVEKFNHGFKTEKDFQKMNEKEFLDEEISSKFEKFIEGSEFEAHLDEMLERM